MWAAYKHKTLSRSAAFLMEAEILKSQNVDRWNQNYLCTYSRCKFLLFELHWSQTFVTFITHFPSVTNTVLHHTSLIVMCRSLLRSCYFLPMSWQSNLVCFHSPVRTLLWLKESIVVQPNEWATVDEGTRESSVQGISAWMSFMLLQALVQFFTLWVDTELEY